MTSNPDCDCSCFAEYLMNLTIILPEENKTSHWILFNQYLEDYSRLLMSDGTRTIEPCSAKSCSALLNKLVPFKYIDNMEVSDLLINAISVIYMREDDTCCSAQYINRIRHLSRQTNTAKLIAALQGKADLIKILVKFNMISSLPEDSTLLYKETLNIIRYIVSIENPDYDPKSLAEMVLKLTKYAFFRGTTSKNYKRVFLAALAMKATLFQVKDLQKTAEEYAYCLRMYFTATSDLFLTAFEVKSLLYSCFTIIQKLSLFDKYCEEFRKLMPDCPEMLGPRKLVDLSCCQVRKNLNASHFTVPATVEKLSLPKRLEKFVLGDLVGKPRKRKNAAALKTRVGRRLALIPFERRRIYQ